jgi:hypothetical protein
VLESEWLGASKPHRVRCAAGHECTPSPNHVQQGQGICRVCVGRDPAAAERAFRARVAELGGECLYDEWRGVMKPHRVQCTAGHECTPKPNTVQQGDGICRVCARNDPAAAERAFRARVAELGGECLYDEWRGASKPHRVQCAAGHECTPTPTSVRQGRGICRVCARNDPAAAERAFRARVAELGGECLYDEWRGVSKPHRVQCAAGHECTPRPAGMQQGEGPCRICAGRAWDAFYLVVDRGRHRLKFGITSGDPRPRIADHRRAGYVETVRLLTDLPGEDAPKLERAVLSALDMASETPAHGREYFDASVLALVLDVIDNYRERGDR